MEVNQERLPPLCPFGLIAPRSGSDAASGLLFLDCLQPAPSSPAPSSSPLPSPPPAASSISASTPPASPKVSDAEPPDDDQLRVEAAPAHDEADDDDRDDEKKATEAQVQAAVAILPVSDSKQPTPDKDEVIAVPSAKAADEATAVAKAPAATEEHSAATTAVVQAEQIVTAKEDAVVTTQAVAEAAADQIATTKQVTAEKHKPAKEAKTEGEGKEKASDSSTRQVAAKPFVPPSDRQENITVPGPPEVPPLESAKSDESDPAIPGKSTVTATADGKVAVAPPDPIPPPVPESPPAATTPATNPVAAAATAAPIKPPAILLKEKNGAAEAARPAGEIDPARFLSRVAKAFESAHERGSEVRLRLHPAELGALSIEVKIQDSALTATVHAETHEAKAAIVDNLPALRERLAEQGIRIDQFDVDLMDHSDQRQQSWQEQTRRQDQQQTSLPRAATRRAVSEPQPIAAPARPQNGSQRGLNVII
jgi:flagellar hook-length control protein FliK